MDLFARVRPRVRQRTLPSRVEVDIHGVAVPVAVRSPSRALRYTLRVPATGEPVLSIPPRGSLEEALDFLDRHRPWLAQRLTRRPSGVVFADGAILPLLGVDHRIEHRPDTRGTAWIEPAPPGDELPRIVVAGRAEHLSRRLTDYLKRRARDELEQASHRHATALGVTFRSITIKDTRSRWGSCSSSGALAYSWRVVLAPASVLDYLAAHEVAHLVEMNHSSRFWRLVARNCPNWRVERDWLKRHGHLLHAYGA